MKHRREIIGDTERGRDREMERDTEKEDRITGGKYTVLRMARRMCFVA